MVAIITPVVQLAGNKTLLNAESGTHFFLNVPGDVKATNILTFTTIPLNTNTVTIDGKVYTFLDTVGTADGNVHIGANTSATIDNLIDAINLGPGAGTDYGVNTTLHPSVSALAGTGDTMDATAKIGGPAGNNITASDTLAGASAWTAANFAGGAFGTTPGNNDFVLDLPTNPPDGTNYAFTTEDNGIGVVSGQTFFTNWKINSPVADGFIVRGNAGSVPAQLLTTPKDNQPFTDESIIIGFSGSAQNAQRRYEIGETIELTYYNGKWRGIITSGSNILGIGDI